MKTPRLIPVVIAAAAALLLLKGIGIMSGDGYVLSGTGVTMAAGGGHGGGDAGAGAEPTMALPNEATMSDTSPTLDDGAVTLPLGRDTGHGATADTGHGAPADTGHGEPAGDHAAPAIEAAADTACPTDPAATEAGHEVAADDHSNSAGFDFSFPDTGCKPTAGVNEHGDALPMVTNGAGELEPMATETGSEAEVLARLGERRDTLDAREAEIEMRLALVGAAEKRIAERTAALQALEARINALVEEKKTAEQQQFVGIVAMYETMKPKEAATILNQLEMPVLLRVARAMNPRKMAPILARMDPMRAKDLTAGLAADQGEPTIDLAAEDLSSLPQIVGQ